jgi:hypothetical protein
MLETTCYRNILGAPSTNLPILDREGTFFEGNTKAFDSLGFDPKGKRLGEVFGKEDIPETDVKLNGKRLALMVSAFACPNEQGGDWKLVTLRSQEEAGAMELKKLKARLEEERGVLYSWKSLRRPRRACASLGPRGESFW